MCPVCNFSLILGSADGPLDTSGDGTLRPFDIPDGGILGESFFLPSPLSLLLSRGDFAFLKDSDKYEGKNKNHSSTIRGGGIFFSSENRPVASVLIIFHIFLPRE